LAVGVLASSQVAEPNQMILVWGVVVRVGTGGMSMVLAAVVAKRWFEERRGMVTESGWRAATLWIGGFAALVVAI